jgi:hypothetical protein
MSHNNLFLDAPQDPNDTITFPGNVFTELGVNGCVLAYLF